jgi:hypothetical protein
VYVTARTGTGQEKLRDEDICDGDTTDMVEFWRFDRDLTNDYGELRLSMQDVV